MKEIIFTVLFLGAIIVFDYYMGAIGCNAKAKAIGYKSEYHFFSGCVLEKPNGKKVLLKQLRDYND